MKTLLKLILINAGIFILGIFSLHSVIANVLIDILTLIAAIVLLIIGFGIMRLMNLRYLFQALRFRQKGKGHDTAPSYLKINYQGIWVNYLVKLNGGGVILAYEFVRILSKKIGKVDHVFEYCAGPGFIGFSLLANNLCDSLTLADVNPKAVAAVKKTIKDNHLEDRVKVYQSDCLGAIPSNERWDLVVGNPPWHLRARSKRNIILNDPKSRIHTEFFRSINKHLKPGGRILFVEGGEYTTANDFKDMIEENGLKLNESFYPVSFWNMFSGRKEYRKLGFSLFVLLRLGMAFREVYFIFVGKESNEEITEAYQSR